LVFLVWFLLRDVLDDGCPRDRAEIVFCRLLRPVTQKAGRAQVTTEFERTVCLRSGPENGSISLNTEFHTGLEWREAIKGQSSEGRLLVLTLVRESNHLARRM
jgi:hypothetical protein